VTREQALFMGLLQGATELFPVSSLGHSVIIPTLLHWRFKQSDPTFVPFLVLLVAYCLTWLWRRPNRKWHRVAGIYVGLVFLSFAFFYTQLAAWPVPEWYADMHYWLPSWQ